MRSIVCTIVLASALFAPTQATALTVTHDTGTFDGTVKWGCPGENPVEHYTLTARSTTFMRDGTRVRTIEHDHWRGWIQHRETGALIRDDGTWTIVYTFSPNGHKVVRRATTGSVWRLTIPGHGIVVHQTGREVFDETAGEPWSSTYGGFADPSKMCPYV